MRWVVERQFCLFLLPQHLVYPSVFYLLTEHHRCIIPNRFSNVNGCSIHWGQWIGSPSSVFCILLLWQPAPLILLFCSICAVLEKSRKLRTRTGKFWRSFKQKTTESKSWSRYCESFTRLKPRNLRLSFFNERLWLLDRSAWMTANDEAVLLIHL